MDISVGILTKNEEANIRECILSIKEIAKEIVILDDYSSDNTEKIANELGAKFYKRRLDNFSNQRNFLLEKCNCEWVFILDADERVDEELREEIKKINDPCEEGFMIFRKNFIFGKYLKYGGNGNDWQLRLFKKEKVEFTSPVHEKIKVKGKIGKIRKGSLLHYSTTSISSYIKKLIHYTDLEIGLVRRRRFLKLRLVLCPLVEFLKRYFLQLGFLDGREGFIFYVLSAFYVFIKYTKAILK
jgi:glycosyltransferase involved in cell wall biosynthesis